MDEDRFDGIADRRALSLCIRDDRQCHRQLGCLVDVDMIVAGAGFDHWHRGGLFDTTNQAGASPRDQNIQVICQPHQLSRCFVARVFDKLDRMAGVSVGS